MAVAVAHAALKIETLARSAGRIADLPGGILAPDGTCYRRVELRELNGADEELLCGRFDSGARQVTALLQRAIARIEGWSGPIDAELVSNMLAGDRDYLLLRLRQIEIGDGVHEVLRCCAPGCGKKADVDFLISEMPVRRLQDRRARFSIQILDEQGKPRVASLRWPTGADLDAVAPLIEEQPGAANTRLYARTLHALEGYEVGTEERVRALPLRIRAQLAAFLERNAPGPDLSIDVACPHCGSDLTYTFDLRSFFLPSAS